MRCGIARTLDCVRTVRTANHERSDLPQVNQNDGHKATDFWREPITANRDSGHFLSFPTAEAFITEIRIQGDFDQAGIMLRVDAYCARPLIVGGLFTLQS